jgi:DNA-binding NtrC family response regulator
MPVSTPSTVAICNASADTLEMLRTAVSQQGYRAVEGYADVVKSGELDFVALVEEHRPDALIWDIAPPHDRNWNFFKLLRSSHLLDHCVIVITTTNKKHLESLATQTTDTGAIELVGKPYDIDVIVLAVARELQNRNSAGPRAGGSPRE